MTVILRGDFKDKVGGKRGAWRTNRDLKKKLSYTITGGENTLNRNSISGEDKAWKNGVTLKPDKRTAQTSKWGAAQRTEQGPAFLAKSETSLKSRKSTYAGTYGDGMQKNEINSTGGQNIGLLKLCQKTETHEGTPGTGKKPGSDCPKKNREYLKLGRNSLGQTTGRGS